MHRHSCGKDVSKTQRAKTKKKWKREEQNNSGLPSRKNYRICIERAPIIELKAILRESGYLRVILEFNLPIDDQLACANVCPSRQRVSSDTRNGVWKIRTKVVSASLAPYKQDETSAIYARVETETDSAKSV